MAKKQKNIDDIPMLILKNIAEIRTLDLLVDELQIELQQPKPKKTTVDKLRLKIKRMHDKLLGRSGADWSCAMARDILNQTM